MSEWEPEHLVSAAAAAKLISGRFPELRGMPVEPLATGWDNTVFSVGGRWVFRFPRKRIALPGVEREIAMLPRLAPSLPLAIPVPEFVGRPASGFPWPFWGARFVPGRELAETGGDRARAAARLGGFLRALHDPRLVAELGSDLPYDPFNRANPGVRAPRAREWLARLAEKGLYEAEPGMERLLAAGERIGPPRGVPVVCHGDLHVRHLLVDEDGDASGVIDWGDLCLADPAADLSIAYAAFTGAARTAFFSAYGQSVDAERETRARVLAVFLSAVLAEYAAATGRTRLREEALAGIRRAVAG